MTKPIFIPPTPRVPGIAATLLGTDAVGYEKHPMFDGFDVEDGLGRGEAMLDIQEGGDSPSDRRLSCHWEKPMALLVEEGRPLQGIAILHGHAEGDVECLQQGMKMSDSESKLLVQRIAAGELHTQLLHVEGREYLLTNLSEFAIHGRSTNVTSGDGIVIVRTEQLAIVGLYTKATAVPEAIQAMCEFGDDLSAAGF